MPRLSSQPITAMANTVTTAGRLDATVMSESAVGWIQPANWYPNSNPNAAGTTVIRPIKPLAFDN